MLKNHAVFGFNPLALIIIAEQILQMYCNELINWDDFSTKYETAHYVQTFFVISSV